MVAAMGLAERRATKDFQDRVLPGLEAELHAAAGFTVALEVAWTELAVEDYAPSYEEFWTKVYFTPTLDALRSITRDDLGREALAAGLTKIVFRNSAGHYSPEAAASFADKVLTVDHSPASNVDDIASRTAYLTRLLEKGL